MDQAGFELTEIHPRLSTTIPSKPSKYLNAMLYFKLNKLLGSEMAQQVTALATVSTVQSLESTS